jgi:hypothetical protein
VGDIGVIGRIVLSRPGVLTALVVGILVLVPVAVMCARQLGWSRTRTVWAGLCGASFALVPATTLARSDALIEWGRSCGTEPNLSLASPEAQLNAILFAPAVFTGVLALRRAAPVVVSALVSSVAIETIQAVTLLGTCQAADVVRNVTGAVAAGGVAALMLRLFATTTDPGTRSLSGSSGEGLTTISGRAGHRSWLAPDPIRNREAPEDRRA